jgi:hypothetical protein
MSLDLITDEFTNVLGLKSSVSPACTWFLLPRTNRLVFGQIC